LQDELPERVVDRAKKSAARKGDPSTPPRASKKLEPNPHDDSFTPEKTEGLPRRVHGCRPVPFGQPPAPDTTLKAAKQTPKPEDVLPEGDEDEDDGVNVNKVTRQSHKRTCRKKTWSLSEKKMISLRNYMASIKLTWPVFLSKHTRQDVLDSQGFVRQYRIEFCSVYGPAQIFVVVNGLNLGPASMQFSCLELSIASGCLWQDGANEEDQQMPGRWVQGHANEAPARERGEVCGLQAAARRAQVRPGRVGFLPAQRHPWRNANCLSRRC